jgi:pSer/pThr/pTyr-binding forkhead associated (FHA) protein/predicted amidophosphoribosyltransferase
MSSFCSTCNQPVKDGAAFCQSCGAKVADTASMRPVDGAAGLPAPTSGRSPRAPVTGRTLLGAAPAVRATPASAVSAAPAAPAELVSTVICPDCETANKIGMNFCKMCGAPLRIGKQPPAPARGKASALAAAVGTAPTARTAAANRNCPSCGGQTPAAFEFCQHCGKRMAPDDGDAEATPPASEEEVVPLVKRRPPEPGTIPPFAHLVTVLRDGTDGEVHALRDDLIDLGRTEGQILFADDRFLAARHARIERRGDAVLLLALDTVNGVYVRARPGEVVTLGDGDLLLIGKQVLRFEVLEPEERVLRPALQHGVCLFGSPGRTPWARLCQVMQSGIALDVIHLVPTEVVLGREEGDLRFPDDEFMSRRHARVTNRDGKFELLDLDSSNGTYVRLRGERQLRTGDQLRIGDQLFRYNPVP